MSGKHWRWFTSTFYTRRIAAIVRNELLVLDVARERLGAENIVLTPSGGEWVGSLD